MEFLFLIQNISLEIIILLSSVLLLIIFLIRYLYHEASRVIHALTPRPITRSSLIETTEVFTKDGENETTEITPAPVYEDNITATEDTNTPTEISEKVDTSQVEKLV